MKELALTKGKYAQVDDDDYVWLSKHTWCATEVKPGVFYARTFINLKPFYMHRMIMGVSDRNTMVDHKDQNPLNNQKENLRICNRGQNRCNSKTKNKYGFRGVGKYGRTWSYTLVVNKERIVVTGFSTKEDAAKAYNVAAQKYHGEFATLNEV